ncbi:MAG: DUF3806 domain-containing protein [Halieaceae bacterium]
MACTRLLPALLIALLASLPGLAGAQQAPRISALSAVDRQFMQEQRDSIDELARTELGKQLRREKFHDIALLQTLLDRRLVRPEQVLLLQAMGVVMGDLLAQELGMNWVVYEDKLGRSRALRYALSDDYLFPITMISRRAEVGARVDVAAIYQKALSLIQPTLPKKPFQ